MPRKLSGALALAEVTVNTRALSRMPEVVRDVAVPRMAQELRRALEERAQTAAAAWPTSTGRSARAFDVQVTADPDSIRGAIENTASYAGDIRGREHGGRLTWDVLVAEPLREGRDELLQRLADTAAEVLSDA